MGSPSGNADRPQEAQDSSRSQTGTECSSKAHKTTPALTSPYTSLPVYTVRQPPCLKAALCPQQAPCFRPCHQHWGSGCSRELPRLAWQPDPSACSRHRPVPDPDPHPDPTHNHCARHSPHQDAGQKHAETRLNGGSSSQTPTPLLFGSDTYIKSAHGPNTAKLPQTNWLVPPAHGA